MIEIEQRFNQTMGHTKAEGANPISHLINRQIGNSIFDFRQNLYRERLASARNLYRKNLVAHYGCVNAIEFSSNGDLLTSGRFYKIYFRIFFIVLLFLSQNLNQMLVYDS